VLLQPSWTWGALGGRHFAIDALRAVESGATLIRCASDGISGAVSPYGERLYQRYTAASDFAAFTVPAPRTPVWTLYSRLGFVFGWFCVAFAALYWLTLAGIVPPVLFDSRRTDFDVRVNRQLSRSFSRQYSARISPARAAAARQLFAAGGGDASAAAAAAAAPNGGGGVTEPLLAAAEPAGEEGNGSANGGGHGPDGV